MGIDQAVHHTGGAIQLDHRLGSLKLTVTGIAVVKGPFAVMADKTGLLLKMVLHGNQGLLLGVKNRTVAIFADHSLGSVQPAVKNDPALTGTAIQQGLVMGGKRQAGQGQQQADRQHECSVHGSLLMQFRQQLPCRNRERKA